MFVLSPEQKTGKIFQLKQAAERLTFPRDLLVIQTAGTPLACSIKCTNRNALRLALAANRGRHLVIFTISSFTVDEEIVSWLYKHICTGCNIFLYSVDRSKLWYVDDLIEAESVPIYTAQ